MKETKKSASLCLTSTQPIKLPSGEHVLFHPGPVLTTNVTVGYISNRQRKMSVDKFVERVQREPFHCICQANLVCSHFYGQYNPSVDKQKHANEFTMSNFANILQYLPKNSSVLHYKINT